MLDFNTEAIDRLKEFLKDRNIERLKTIFIKGFHDPEGFELGIIDTPTPFTFYSGLPIFDIEYKKGNILTGFGSGHEVERIRSFEKEILEPKLIELKNKVIAEFDLIKKKQFDPKNEEMYSSYAMHIIKYIKKSSLYSSSLSKFSTCQDVLSDIQLYVEIEDSFETKQSNTSSIYNIEVTDNSAEKNQGKDNKPNSFRIKVEDGENETDKIKKLYNLLCEAKAIKCSENEFIKAFTNQEVSEGIKWLVCNPKNKDVISKPALIHFLNELADHGIIDKEYYNYTTTLIAKVFRRPDGSKYTSAQIATSKSNMSRKTPLPEKLSEITPQL